MEYKNNVSYALNKRREVKEDSNLILKIGLVGVVVVGLSYFGITNLFQRAEKKGNGYITNNQETIYIKNGVIK